MQQIKEIQLNCLNIANLIKNKLKQLKIKIVKNLLNI
jgi:hypothetical protein